MNNSSREKPKLVLASASPARLELLRGIGLEPEIVASADIDETPGKNEIPREYALRIAIEKARKIKEKYPGYFIIAADTIAAAGRRIIGKAADEKGARKILELLSGRRHRVYSGLCIINPEGEKLTRIVQTVVKFKKLDKKELDQYIASKQWQGKSGCYGIQSRAGGFIEWINGSFSNVVGLPLAETKKLLMGAGFNY